MKMIRAGTITAAISAMLLGAAPAAAQEIYRWVDANGVVNFSDTVPAAESSGISTVVIENTQPAEYKPEPYQTATLGPPGRAADSGGP
jgi:hypothetical protein